jgi:hypothetical protein
VSLALAIGGIAYLIAYGARTPLLALRGLTRVRNLALIIVPAVAVGLIALLLQGRVDDRVAAGAIALAVVPAPFVAPEIVGRMRGRADLAGALVLGTALLSLLVSGSRGALSAGALFTAVEAFAIAAMVAGALPTLRDALLGVLRVVGWGSVVLIAIAAAVVAPPLLDAPPIGSDPPLVLQSAVVALALLVAGVGSAALVAWIAGRDPIAAVGGAGLRDPALAVVLAAVTAGRDSTGVPLVYGVFCVVLAALSLARR